MRCSGRTTRMIDQVLDWCRDFNQVPEGKPGPVVAIMCADSNHRKNLQAQFMLRANEREGMNAQRSPLEEIHLWAGNGDYRCSVAFRTPRETAMNRGHGMNRVFADHYAIEVQLARALEPFGSAFNRVDPATTINRAVAELVPDQYREKE